MGFARSAGLGLLASSATMLTRRTTRGAMHRRSGEPRLPNAAKDTGVVTILLLAVGAGALLAIADVLKEQRKEAARGEGAPAYTYA